MNLDEMIDGAGWQLWQTTSVDNRRMDLGVRFELPLTIKQQAGALADKIDAEILKTFNAPINRDQGLAQSKIVVCACGGQYKDICARHTPSCCTRPTPGMAGDLSLDVWFAFTPSNIEAVQDAIAAVQEAPVKCECGSAACGSGAHSDWCPAR